MTWEIRQGDALDLLRAMPAASVDAVVTDPPYGLSFMGKEWDHGVPGEPFWVEALRVAKPGAHLVAFGGTRTYHRLTCAIEDAGFQVRDCLMWLYGSGFPKSLDVSKAIDKRKDWAALKLLQASVRKARKALGISQSEAARRMGLIPEGESPSTRATSPPPPPTQAASGPGGALPSSPRGSRSSSRVSRSWGR